MYNLREDQTSHVSVSVESIDGKWVVTIVENFDALEREFDSETFARSFADGQRYRLGIAAAE